MERYVNGSTAARQFVKQLLEAVPPPNTEDYFFANVALPAVRRLVNDGKVKEAGRCIEYIQGLCLSGDWKRLNETVSGQAHLAELRAGLASYANPSSGSLGVG